MSGYYEAEMESLKYDAIETNINKSMKMRSRSGDM
jgi:hypothetical protein